ncbi:hypothetical protein [Dactylosporangium sp. NPDC051484]|uniref:hypothetical protein n=1 Tax=Dactylosporangium sp. NPDC051484 TaxID=3154942 RepID=UPI00344DBD90
MHEEGISAGSVYVDIRPRADGFWPEFVRTNLAGATAAGEQIGRVIGRVIAQEVARGVRDGLGGSGIRAQGARAGAEYGGTFADTAKRRIEAALRSLPTPQIGVATTGAEQKLKDLRGELSTLASKRIGVDIGATEALAEVRRIKTELDELAGKSPSAQVRVDAANAAIELLAIDRELNRLDGRRANAKVDVDSNAAAATRDMNVLVNTAFALGPAIVPGAVAGTAAILALGSAALSAAPAIGVIGLAYRGVGGAIKALADAQRDTPKSGGIDRQQRSLASTADQIRSAEASLANTRANAADSQRRSLQQIADAERQVGAAQREAQRAQLALNDAREAERLAQQDTAFRLRQNAIDQRRAVAEVAAAQSAAAWGGGEQSRLAYQEALLRQEQLKAAGEQLAAEQERNTKSGIDGSKRVVAAQEAIAQSQERVTAAERGVTQARDQAASQARQSAYSIAQAQQSVISAQRAAGAATVAAATSGTAAIDKLDEAMRGLPVSAQTFARYLFSLRPRLQELQATAANGVLPGAQQSIETILPYFGNLNSFVGDVAGTIGVLEVRAAKTFTSPVWRGFFSFIAGNATPVLHGLYETTVNVGEGFAHILMEFAPVERQVGAGVLKLSERFRDWSRTLESNQGFQSFVRYAQTEGPKVVRTIGELVTVGGHIVQAYAPVGSLVVTELRILGEVINAIPVPVITTLATAITAYKTAALLTGGAQSLLNSGLLTGIGRMITFRTVVDEARVATTGMQRALSATSGFIGGPFLVAATAAVTVLALLAEKQAETKVNTDSYRSALEEYARAFKDGVTPAALESAKAILANNVALRGLVEVTQSHNIKASEVVAGLNGEADARKRVVDAIDDHIGALWVRVGYESGDAAKADKEQIERLEGMKVAFLDSSASAAEAGRLTGQLASEQRKTNDIFESAKPAVKSLADSYKILADSTSTAADKARALKDAEDALFGAARQADEANEAQAKAILATNKTLDTRNLLNADGARKLDMTSEAGLRVRDSLKEQLNAINATFRANVAAGMSIDEATRKHQEEIDKLRDKTSKKGIDKKATEDLISIYGQIPTAKTTDVTIRGLDATKAQLDELLAYQLALRTGISLTEARNKINPQHVSPDGRGASNFSASAGYATGGLVVGPGTGTSDSVPAMERSTGTPFWLSNREFVQPAASVDYYGQGFMEAVRHRTISREAIRGYATGGLINDVLTEHYPFPTTVANMKIPSRAEVARVATEGPSSGGSEDIKAFIRAAGKLPYIWAAAGPFGYDCSGLVSAVYGLIRGLGGGHGQRYFVTQDFTNGAPAGFKPGPGGVLTVGVNPATHMAGNYGGLGFEAASTRSGIKIGTAARKTGTFEKQFHLATGGLVNVDALRGLGLDVGGDPSGMTINNRRVPLGVYDSGGRLPQGLSLAYNGTGRPELVQTAQQERAAERPSITIPVHASDGMSVQELAKAVAAELAWQTR